MFNNVFTSVCQGDQGAVGQEVWCQLACRRRRGIWLRDQLRGNAGNAIVFTSMQNAIKMKEEVCCRRKFGLEISCEVTQETPLFLLPCKTPSN
jgi:hypothetical protein